MSNRYLNPPPLPYENNVALTLFAEERPPLDVVESPLVARPRLHLDGLLAERPRGFVAPTLFDVTGHHPDPEHDDDDVDDEDLDAGDRDGEDNDEYVVSRHQLLERDHLEREACRADSERERDERRALRNARAGNRVRRRAATRAGRLDAHRKRHNEPNT